MMPSVLSVLALGFLLGLRHATDADHVVAVTTIVSRERRLRASSLIGALWGIGHTLTIALVGGAIVMFHVVIPARLGLAMELAVALMLIALGMATLSGRLASDDRTERPAAELLHSGGTALGPPQTDRGRTARIAARPVVVGIVHGLAGSGAVALLVLSTIANRHWALAYLAIFGLGTVAGMMLLTTAIALPFAYTARRFDRVNAMLARVTSLASIVLGFLIAYQLIAAHGLFSSAPQWTPQ